MILSEFTRGILKIIRNIVGESSIMLAVIYTIGHIFIATICNWLITGAAMELAALDAIIEPIINGFWFYALHRFAKKYFVKETDNGV